MAHPFFETSIYPAYREEAKVLQQELNRLYKTAKEIDAVYRACAPEPPNLTDTLTPALIWLEALQNLTKRGCVRTLCDNMLVKWAGNPAVTEAIQAVIEAEPTIDQKVLPNGMPMVNRKPLRTLLESLESQDTALHILLVRGAAKSGKSYSRHLFFEMARRNGAKPIYICKERVSTVHEAVEEIFSALGNTSGEPTSAEQVTTTPAWHRSTCKKILAWAEKEKKTAWIAVDDLGLDQNDNPFLDSAIRQFFNEFADSMTTPQFQERFKLMLIHYPEGDVPTHWEGAFWNEDRTSVTDLNVQDVVDTLRAGLKRKRLTLLDDNIQADASGVIAGADTQAAMARLKTIDTAVRAKLASYTQAPAP